jgi:hypothetical protein
LSMLATTPSRQATKRWRSTAASGPPGLPWGCRPRKRPFV